MVGQVVHGIELVKLAKEGDLLSTRIVPSRIDLLGLPLEEAKKVAAARGIAFAIDTDGADRIVVSQEPGTTLDVLSERSATVTTAPFEQVIDIELDDARAPMSCDVFRRITGLKEHDAGMMPAFFVFDDVYLFSRRSRPPSRSIPRTAQPGKSPAQPSPSPMTRAKGPVLWGCGYRRTGNLARLQNRLKAPISSGA